MTKHADDANGDALRRMEAQGDDLPRPRDIEFTVVFPDQTSSKQFADHFRGLGYTASVDLSGTVADSPWDVVVVQHMVPSYEEIGAFESALQGIAGEFGGRNDGWGCLSEKSSDRSS